jgi:hypothetical protein
MATKTKDINFTHKGGVEVVTFNALPNVLPLTYKLSEDITWLHIKLENNVIVIECDITYDYNNREVLIEILNNKGNKVFLNVKQQGFNDINIRCDSTLVLRTHYFLKHNFYKFYVTIYGGATQDLICEDIQDNIIKVWDNSNMYNDFLINICENLSGVFTLKHSEYDNYKEYCLKNNIFFDEKRVKRDIEIVQITDDDALGEMVLKYDNKIYNRGDIIPVNITYNNVSIIEIEKMVYTKQVSLKKYEVVTDKNVDYSNVPDWIEIKKLDDKLYISATKTNNYTPRVFRLRLTNSTNPHQYIYLDIKQGID